MSDVPKEISATGEVLRSAADQLKAITFSLERASADILVAANQCVDTQHLSLLQRILGEMGTEMLGIQISLNGAKETLARVARSRRSERGQRAFDQWQRNAWLKWSMDFDEHSAADPTRPYIDPLSPTISRVFWKGKLAGYVERRQQSYSEDSLTCTCIYICKSPLKIAYKAPCYHRLHDAVERLCREIDPRIADTTPRLYAATERLVR